MDHPCRMCGSSGLEPVLHFGRHPIAHRFPKEPGSDEYVHPVELRFCPDCGLVQLVDPIPPDKLYNRYVSLSSWKAQPHVPQLVETVLELPGIGEDSRIVEVGSNDGIFLAALREEGLDQLLGLEPAEDAREAARTRGIPTLDGYFTETSARRIREEGGAPDVLVARHVLEHVQDLQAFRDALQMLLEPGAHVLVEVPNFALSLSTLDYSAIWEEHVNYFTSATLRRFLERSGVDVVDETRFRYSGEAIALVGTYRGTREGADQGQDLTEVADQVDRYRKLFPEFKEAFTNFLRDRRAGGETVAVYGAGCRACSLINYLDLGEHLCLVVDDQSEKQGLYMPGSKLPIRPSSALMEEDIDLCLLAVNAENNENVIRENRSFLDRGGEFVPVLPPTEDLPPFWSDMLRPTARSA